MLSWGRHSAGQLGQGGIEEDHVVRPRFMRHLKCSASEIESVACGWNHALVTLKGGEVYSFGSNEHGQLAQPSSRSRPERIRLLQNEKLGQVSCGEGHSIAVTQDGLVLSWGDNRSGQLSQDLEVADGHRPLSLCFDDTDEDAPAREDMPVVPCFLTNFSPAPVVCRVACGARHTIALTICSDVLVWGSNERGQCACRRDVKECRQPRQVPSIDGTPIVFIAAGGTHSLALSAGGRVYSWGGNAFGQLGLGHTEDEYDAREIEDLHTQRPCYMSCGEDHSALLTEAGGLMTFGSGSSGQLGHGSERHEARPRQVIELMGSEVTQVACGRRHTLAVVGSTGQLFSFGLDGSGQLGTGKKSMQTLPCSVHGQWASYDSPNSVAGLSSVDSSPRHVVHCVAAGGDQSFVVVDAGIPPIDMRLATDSKDFLIPHDFAASRPIFISKRIVENLLHRYPLAGTRDAQMHSLLRYIFGNPACLSLSCLNPVGSPCPYNMSDLDQTLKLLNDYDALLNRRIMHMFVQGVLTQKMKTWIPRTIEACHVFLFLLAMPLLRQSPSWDPDFMLTFAQCFARTNRKQREAIAKWYSSEVDKFKIAVDIICAQFSACLDLLLMEKLSLPDIKPVLALLEFLFLVNEFWCHVYPVEHFYVSKLTDSQFIDANDYQQWRQRTVVPVSFCSFPFVLDLRAKSMLLQLDNECYRRSEEMKARLHTMFTNQPELPFLLINVRRDHIINDALRQLTRANILGQLNTADLRKPLKVEFMNEEGIDDGGVKKEFFMILFRNLLSADYGMFQVYADSNTVYFSQFAEMEDDLSNFNLIGMLCGLAIYNNVIIDVSFPTVLYHKLMQRFKASREYQDDLQFSNRAMQKVPISRRSREESYVEAEDFKLFADFEPVVARTFHTMLTLADDVSAYDLRFEITRRWFDMDQVIELKPGGSSVLVTNSNREEFVHLYVEYVLHTSIEKQFKSFADGFFAVCENHCFGMLHPAELQALVIGAQVQDFTELAKVTRYQDVFSPAHPVIVMFWEVFHELGPVLQQKFFQFLTGSDRVPVGGIQGMQLIIQPSNGGDDYLPVAHTCFNVLDLPFYRSKESMRRKLLQAVDLAEGFHLI